MRRTTAGINFFRISGQATERHDDWSAVSDEVRKAEDVLKEITLDNEKLRESNEIKETTRSLC